MFKFDATERYGDSEFEVRDPNGYVLVFRELDRVGAPQHGVARAGMSRSQVALAPQVLGNA